MGNGSRPNPKGDRSLHGRLFQVLHNEGRLLSSVDVQPCARPCDLNLDVCPFPRQQIDIGFIFARAFRAKFLPWESWHGDVLNRMIALLLVIGSAVLWAEIDALEMEPVR